jgi:DNA polymerase I/DNA polymerase-2
MVQYRGGFVKEPKTGIFKNIIVLDFSSMLPSIIITHNIDVKTMNCKHKKCKKNKVPGFKRWFCIEKEGKIPKRVKKLLEDRKKIKKKLKKNPRNKKLILKEKQLKLAANITYGYFGYKQSPYYNVKAAESIAAFGRFYLKKVIKEAEKNKFKILYADTDSVFLTGSQKKAKIFLKKINKKLPGIIKLEFQGLYKKGLFVSRKTGVGAKKKYALINRKGEMLIKGFESQRGDWCLLAKNVQKQVLKLVLQDKKDKAVKYVKRIVSNLKKGKAKYKDLVIKVQLAKPLSKYKVTGPHIAVARKLKSKDKRVEQGMIISFVITKGKGSISERARASQYAKLKNIDFDYYINNQIVPASLRALSIFGVTKEHLLGQKSLK